MHKSIYTLLFKNCSSKQEEACLKYEGKRTNQTSKSAFSSLVSIAHPANCKSGLITPQLKNHCGCFFNMMPVFALRFYQAFFCTPFKHIFAEIKARNLIFFKKNKKANKKPNLRSFRACILNTDICICAKGSWHCEAQTG